MVTVADTGRDVCFRRRKGEVGFNAEAVTEHLMKKIIHVLGGAGRVRIIPTLGRRLPSLSALLEPRNIKAWRLGVEMTKGPHQGWSRQLQHNKYHSRTRPSPQQSERERESFTRSPDSSQPRIGTHQHHPENFLRSYIDTSIWLFDLLTLCIYWSLDGWQ